MNKPKPNIMNKLGECQNCGKEIIMKAANQKYCKQCCKEIQRERTRVRDESRRKK